MDVVTIGSLTLDSFAYTERSKLLSLGVDDDVLAYKLGTKISLDSLRFELGGGATNTALVFRFLGKQVSVLGKVGSDFVGDEIIRQLAAFGIDFVGERIYGSSAFSIVLDALNHERTILAHKGASENPLCASIPDARLYYLTSPGRVSIDTYAERMPSLRERGMVVFNASAYLTHLGFSRLEGMLRSVDVFICNAEEFELLMGPDRDAGIRTLHSIGVRCVVVTRGPDGVLASDGIRVFESGSRPTKLAETTGAGDAFGATFAAGLLDGLTMEENLDRALVQSASVISFPGPKRGVLRSEELDSVRAELPRIVIGTRPLA